MIRTFIAIDLPDAVRDSLRSLEQELLKTQAPVSWVKPESVHLTIKFLGNVAPEQISSIQEAMREVAAATVPFRIKPLGCGAFPSIKQMRVVWVGLRGFSEDSEPLLKLQQAMEKTLAPMGFKEEDRPFKPHLTLGRVKGRRHLRELQEIIMANQAFEAEAFDVDKVVLYKSELRPEGARYSQLYRAEFSGAV